MKLLRTFLLSALFGFPCLLAAQYNLEEFGVEAGPGLSMLMSGTGNAIGPAANANAFFSHYACGKGYGFHINAGATAMFPLTANGSTMTDQLSTSKMQFSFVSLDVAVLGKLRIHEYHRPREWAVFLGPRLQVPLLARYSNEVGQGSLASTTASVSRILPGIELSMQFRQPIGKKKSWFIHPGAAYFFPRAFNAHINPGPKPLYFFLNFGYALWDQRG
jgi:hypothetical protein